MRQRLAIASTLITNPEFLILDEPTNGLDPSGMVEMREIIQRLVTERGMTVLLSSHLLDELSESLRITGFCMTENLSVNFHERSWQTKLANTLNWNNGSTLRRRGAGRSRDPGL